MMRMLYILSSQPREREEEGDEEAEAWGRKSISSDHNVIRNNSSSKVVGQ